MNEMIKAVQAAEGEVLLGNVILYPTDTVWGIGCDAEQGTSVRKIFKIKEREESKTMILLVANLQMLEKYVTEVPQDLEKLVQEQQRPTTYVFPEAKNLPKELLAADGSVAIRIVNDEFCHRLLMQLGRPIVSTSANISGEPAPASFSDVSEEIKKRVDLVVPWRQEEKIEAKPSRIVKIGKVGKHEVLRD